MMMMMMMMMMIITTSLILLLIIMIIIITITMITNRCHLVNILADTEIRYILKQTRVITVN